MNNEEPDGRMSFDESVRHVRQAQGKAAFCAIPFFGERTDDEEQRAEGARVFILVADGEGSYQIHFVAAPFFANAFEANETVFPDAVPDWLKDLRFMPTRFEEAWLTIQVQLLIQKLVQASNLGAPEMPDYANTPTAKADGETVFPISFIGRPDR